MTFIFSHVVSKKVDDNNNQQIWYYFLKATNEPNIILVLVVLDLVGPFYTSIFVSGCTTYDVVLVLRF